MPDVEALRRFAAKCRFKPSTGCVLWEGAKTPARDGAAKIGRFKYEGRNWSARRWAAKHIHGLDIEGGKVAETTCGDERCVQHVKMGGEPSGHLRMHWLLQRIGYGDPPEEEEKRRVAQRARETDDGELGMHVPPDWLAQYAPVIPPFDDEEVPF